MKILRVVSAGYQQGGAENGIVLTNEILRNMGHEVRVLSSDVSPELQHFSDDEFRSVRTSGIYRIIDAAYNSDAHRVMKRLLDSFKPDVVLFHTLSQPTASVLFAAKDYPSILFVHGPELYTTALLPWYLNKSDYRHGTFQLRDLKFTGWVHYLYFLFVCRTIYKIALPSVITIVALSSYTAGMLRNEGIQPTYIPNGVGLLQASLKAPAVPTILYAGRLEKFKGIHNVINALPAIQKQIPNIKLQIAGTGSYLTDLEALVKKIGLQSAVQFLGQLDSGKLADTYQSCSIFVLPSTWPETFGKSGVEAMSAGRPVIATDVGGVRDWLHDGENGYLVQPDQPDQIAQRAIEILQDHALWQRMSAAAITTATQFSITAMAENIVKLCKQAIQTDAAKK